MLFKDLLDKIIPVFQNHNQYTILVTSPTDYKANDALNLKLSIKPID